MKTRELNQNMEIDSVEEAEEILKAAGTEDLFEKAHVHGEVHPNGKWYWDSNAAGGKGDWRVIKKQGEKKETGAKKERKIMENVFKLEDEYYENDEASTEEISKKMQKIIDSNDLSKRDFIRLYVKHGKDFAGGGGITNSDLKDSVLNTIDALDLKFKK